MSEPSKTGSPQIDFILAKERYLKDISLARERYENELRLANERFDRDVNNRNLTSTPENCKLVFKNKISQDILTGELIQGIEVALVDCNTGDVIVAGPHASASVKIVILRGEFEASGGDDDWTTEEFDDNIRDRQGNKPLLLGDVRLKLKSGVAVANNIKFHNDAIKMKPAVFRLGARVVKKCEGIRIKEAMTESFAVKDYRNKYSEKREIPALKDEVWRLKGVQKGGKVDKRLQKLRIRTVEEFLILLMIDPERLKKLIDDAVMLPQKKWEVTLQHARNCQPDKRMYCYVDLQKKRGIVFKLWEQVLGLYILELYQDGKSSPFHALAEHDKADIRMNLASAFEHWEDMVCADDAVSLQQYVTSLINAKSHEPSRIPSGPEGFGTNSANTLWIIETNVIHDHELEIMYDAPTNFYPSSPFDQSKLFMFPNEEMFVTGNHEPAIQHPNEYHDVQQDVLSLDKSGPADETSAAALPEAPIQNQDESYYKPAHEVFAAPMQNLESFNMTPLDKSCPDDEISGKGVPGARRRWKRKLFCLARFLYVSVKDRVSANGDHRPNKMQKVLGQ